jgi:hypothetical protein
MPSLSSYDRGKLRIEGKRYLTDIKAGNQAMDLLQEGMGRWKGRRIFLIGNHEERIERHVQANPELAGTVGYHNLNLDRWDVYDFLKPVIVDGVKYSHFFPRSASGAITQTKRGAPNAKAQLVREGGSCTAGHQQGLDIATLPLRGKVQWGIIAGSCYQHQEEYLSPQGTEYFRGIIVKHEVSKGSYNPMFVGLNYLKHRYGGSGG